MNRLIFSVYSFIEFLLKKTARVIVAVSSTWQYLQINPIHQIALKLKFNSKCRLNIFLLWWIIVNRKLLGSSNYAFKWISLKIVANWSWRNKFYTHVSGIYIVIYWINLLPATKRISDNTNHFCNMIFNVFHLKVEGISNEYWNRIPSLKESIYVTNAKKWLWLRRKDFVYSFKILLDFRKFYCSSQLGFQ